MKQETVTRTVARFGIEDGQRARPFCLDNEAEIIGYRGALPDRVRIVRGTVQWAGKTKYEMKGLVLDLWDATPAEIESLTETWELAVEVRSVTTILILAHGETRSFHEPATARQRQYLAELLGLEDLGIYRPSKRAASQLIEEVLAGKRTTLI